MTANQELCIFPVCSAGENEESIVITQKGAVGINHASVARGDSINIAAGRKVHKKCRLNYINKKEIDRCIKIKQSSTPAAKRSCTRVNSGPYDSKTDCLFCGKVVVLSKLCSDYDDYSFVKTDNFSETILSICKSRNDDWAFTVQGRVEFFCGDLHAADCIYHHSCDINFRTFRDIPMPHRSEPRSDKRRKVGRPISIDQDQAFLRVCAYLEDNDEEQTTITDLGNKMKEYLQDRDSSVYGNQYLKLKLLEHYGDSVVVVEEEGLQDIITFRENTSKILRDYFKQQNTDDEEGQKRAIIETAAKLIKSDIKSIIAPAKNEYPKPNDLNVESTLQYLPNSLLCLLQHLVVGKDTRRKVASLGHAIIQAIRPRKVIAPLQLGLAVQMHHHFRSRFLIDILSSMGFCVSYSEVQLFEENAACSVAQDILGDEKSLSAKMMLFAADNVDHNIMTLDGKGTFHGMGIIAATTPSSRQVSYTVPRKNACKLNFRSQTQIPIIDYNFAKSVCTTIKFKPLPVLEDIDRRIDLLWEVSLKFNIQAPNWQGMMHILNRNHIYPGQSSVQFLPMIDMYPGDKTCILSTLKFICEVAAKYKMPAVVTFDQPLFWKASEIVSEAKENIGVKDAILLLGSFHTLMNVLGAIGTLMQGTGLNEILATVYSENTIMHIMSGKAVQRALRGHLMVNQCLIHLIISKIVETEPGFESHIHKLEQLYCQAEKGDLEVDSMLESDCMANIVSAVNEKICQCSKKSKTSKLWFNYTQMLGVVRELIHADRSGSWTMHLHAISACLPIFAAAGHHNYLKSAYLYFQTMTSLEITNPEVYHKFMQGYHVIRRSNKFWAGLGCDLVIEQTLMRSLKSTGGLTRGSGMSEKQRAIWTMSSPVSSCYNFAMQDFCDMQFTTSEQHKEATATRIVRDKEDVNKICSVLELYSPLSEDTALRNIVTGINADDDVNVHELFSIGKNIVAQMEGQFTFSYSHKRSNKVNTFASAKAVKVSEDRTIDPALLFQRFLVVSQTGELSLDEVMKYELSPYPPALFEAKQKLRKADKPALLEAIRKHATSTNDAILQSFPHTEQYVLDGGSLLHRLHWSQGSTYSSIADHYACFTEERYGKATVVFDGYGKPTPKDNTHERRKTTSTTNIINVTEVTKFAGKKEDFLSNGSNKQLFINMITKSLRSKGCHVIQAEGDADVEIVKAAVANSLTKSTTLIGEDTDLLILLLYYGKTDNKGLYLRSDKGKTHVYNITALKTLLGNDVCTSLLFAHAFTGSDTTSRIFGIGKKSVFEKINKNVILRECSQVFCSPYTDPKTVETTGCKAMLALFNGKESDTLESLRYTYLCKKVVDANSFVSPERLPPTTSATKYHSQRAYFQVMTWMGLDQNMDPTNWGWINEGGKLVPVMMDNKPAPDNLLKLIHCNCSGGCVTRRCSCKKYGLDCSATCGSCYDGNCENIKHTPLTDEEDV